MSVSLELESLGHELLFAVEELAKMRFDINARIARIVSVSDHTENLLPSTRMAIRSAAGFKANPSEKQP
jgi:hypothetical protein